MDDKQFQTRLCTAKCSFGSIDDQYLNIPKDHGVYFKDTDHPLLNANDYVADKHIIQFGRCTSPANPENAAGSILGSVIPILGLMDQLKKAMGCDGCKCSPKTLVAWQNTDKKNHLDGVDGITNQSTTVCFYGGIITITEQEESAEDSDGSDSNDAPKRKKNAMERMPSSVSKNIDKNNTAQRNYANNMNQSVPEGALDLKGFITDPSGLDGFSCGSSSSISDKSGCIASYNASVYLASNVPVDKMILANDVLGDNSGELDSSMKGIEGIFRPMGYKTKVVKYPGIIPKGAVAIIGTRKKGINTFNTIVSKNGQIKCLEGIDSNLEDITANEQKMVIIEKEPLPEVEKLVKNSFEGDSTDAQKEFNSYLRDNVWCREDLSNEQKIEIMKKNFEKLTPTQKKDFNVLSSAKVLKGDDYSNWGAYPNIDWPDFPGLDKSTAKSVVDASGAVMIPKQLDRIGSNYGSNLGIMKDGAHCTQDQRAICYIENKYAQHNYTFNSENYTDSIDAISDFGDNPEEAIDKLNSIIDANNKKNKTDIKHVDFDDVAMMNRDYLIFQNNSEKFRADTGIDTKYGVMGEAAEWTKDGESICSGGAGQVNTPVSVGALEKLGIITDNGGW